jgi:hypothetical protein
VTLTRRQAEALDRWIAPDRLGTYLVAAGGDRPWARRLYLWDRDLAVAFLADIALLEIALRNAMNDQLTRRWGADWYARPDVPLDDRSASQLAAAWSRVSGARTPGRVVAQCMLGFWTGLLDRGDFSGQEPRRVRRHYEIDLWRGLLDRAFRGGRAQARADGETWTRAYAHRVVRRVGSLRNRVAHHEPLVNGYPLAGQHVRLTAEQGHQDCLRLAAMLDRDLRAVLVATSRVPEVLAARPRSRPPRPRAARHASRSTPARPHLR